MEHLGDALARDHLWAEAEDVWRAAANLHAARNAPFRFLLNFYSQDNSEYFRRRVSEQEAAQKLADAADRTQAPQAATLPGLLQQLRDKELSSDWQVARLMECAQT